MENYTNLDTLPWNGNFHFFYVFYFDGFPQNLTLSLICQESEDTLRLPPYMEVEADIPTAGCLGRWPAEAHVASFGFNDDSFIPANFILFNQDQFAVIFLELYSLSVYTRMEI